MPPRGYDKMLHKGPPEDKLSTMIRVMSSKNSCVVIAPSSSHPLPLPPELNPIVYESSATGGSITYNDLFTHSCALYPFSILFEYFVFKQYTHHVRHHNVKSNMQNTIQITQKEKTRKTQELINLLPQLRTDMTKSVIYYFTWWARLLLFYSLGGYRWWPFRGRRDMSMGGYVERTGVGMSIWYPPPLLTPGHVRLANGRYAFY